MDILRQLFGPGDFMPHGYCYLWNSQLVWLNVISDSLIALSYFTIPFGLLWFVRQRSDFPFRAILKLFGVFIVACGATHLMEVWNLWHAQYWLAGGVKAITAVTSMATAAALVSVLPKAAALPGVGEWNAANAELRREIQERQELEESLRKNEATFREQSELLELIHDAILVRNLQNEIVFWNSAAERLYGWSKAEAQGRTTHFLLATQFPYDLALIEAAVLKTGYWEGELQHRTREGRKVVVSSRWALRTGENGEPIGVLESNRDLTKLKAEERRFENLLEAAPDAIVIVNGAGVVQIVNAQTEKLFGYRRDELIGMPVETLVPQAARGQHAQHREAYAQHPQPRAMGMGLELRGRRKDGQEFPVEISLSPLETLDGKLISSSIRDVSDRRRLEHDLRDANEFLEQRVAARTIELAIANSELINTQELLRMAHKVARIGTFDLDKETNTAIWSPEMEDVYGISPGQFDQRLETWRALIHPLDLERADMLSARAQATGQPQHVEFRIKRPDGQIRWIASRARFIFNPEGNLARIVGVNLDITEQRNRQEEITALNATLEQRVAERTAELVRSNKELESFSYSVSHDLRTPLRHIDGFARILNEEFAGELTEEGRHFLDRILHATTHMGHLIDDLLNLARIGRKEINRQDVRMNELVKQSLADLNIDGDRTIEWRVEALPVLNCDPGLLKLVFTNLLANAAKFTQNRPAAVVEVGSLVTDGEPTLFVRDNGVGFDPQYADKLFGVFQRLHRQEEFPGTGIGLATVQRIVHRHGGRIWAESAPERGATFYFTLGPQAYSKKMVEAVESKHA
jgi:PAS domain S-box-containing protein